MPTKRRKKQWWQMLRGPRGHRGLPGSAADSEVALLKPLTLLLQSNVKDLNERVAELERKLAGPHDREDAAVLGRNKQ